MAGKAMSFAPDPIMLAALAGSSSEMDPVSLLPSVTTAWLRPGTLRLDKPSLSCLHRPFSRSLPARTCPKRLVVTLAGLDCRTCTRICACSGVDAVLRASWYWIPYTIEAHDHVGRPDILPGNGVSGASSHGTHCHASASGKSDDHMPARYCASW